MPDNCTIYCKDKQPRKVAEVVRALFPDCSLEGTDDDWTRMTARGKKGELRLTALVYHENGDEFSRRQGEMACTAESGASMVALNEGERENIVAFLYDTELLLGVVADPEFDADPRFEKVIFEIAFRCDGLVFNGMELFNALGEVIMHMNV